MSHSIVLPPKCNNWHSSRAPINPTCWHRLLTQCSGHCYFALFLVKRPKANRADCASAPHATFAAMGIHALRVATTRMHSVQRMSTSSKC